MDPGRVVVVGSCNLDLMVEVAALPRPGETVLGGNVLSRPGGKGANQAVAARRVGAETTFVGAIGDDNFGVTLRASLVEAGVDVARLRTFPGPSGVALILTDPAGENVIAVASGANRRLAGEHLDALGELLAPSVVLLLQLETPVPTAAAAARTARAVGATVVLNAAPAPDPADADLAALLGLVDVLVVNEGEAAALLSETAATDSGADGWAHVAEALRGLGPAATVVTLGSAGAVLADADGAVVVPAHPVDVVDTTGAGDAFCGALAALLAAGRPLAEAVRAGTVAGAVATTAFGAQTALPAAAEIMGAITGADH